MLHQLRQHVSEARYETGEAVLQIQDGMNKMEAHVTHSSIDSDEEGVFPAKNSTSISDKYQSDTLRAMQDLILKRRQSELDETSSGEPSKSEEHSTNS